MAIMSLRQYARHRGVVLSAVQKAIQSDRISTLADGQIDSEIADAEWQRNTTAHAPAVTRRTDQEEDDGGVFGASQYTKARAVREHYQARLAKIEYEERTGRLVPKDQMQVAAYNTNRRIRDGMLNVADRVCGQIAAEMRDALAAAGLAPELAARLDLRAVHGILSGEIRKALGEVADALAEPLT